MAWAAQGTDAWHKARVGKVTSTGGPAITGENKHKDPAEVMREMVRAHFGAEPEFTGNWYTEWGQSNEDFVRQLYQQLSGFFVIQVGFVTHKQFDWLGGSPDGLVSTDGMIEIKCPGSKKDDPDPKFDDIKDLPHYYGQVQILLHVTGRKWCDFIQWAPNGYRIERVEIQDNYIHERLPVYEAFMEEYRANIKSKRKAKPFLDPKYVERDDAELIQAEEDYQAWLNADAVVSQCKEEARQRLIAACKGRGTRGTRFLIHEVKNTGRINYQAKEIKAALSDLDLNQFRSKVKTATTWKVEKNAGNSDS